MSAGGEGQLQFLSGAGEANSGFWMKNSKAQIHGKNQHKMQIQFLSGAGEANNSFWVKNFKAQTHGKNKHKMQKNNTQKKRKNKKQTSNHKNYIQNPTNFDESWSVRICIAISSCHKAPKPQIRNLRNRHFSSNPPGKMLTLFLYNF